MVISRISRIVLLMSITIVNTAIAGPLMYVPLGNTNDIALIDLEKDKVIGRIEELENAHGLATSPNSKYLVAGSMKPVETEDIVVSHDEHKAHHAANNSGGTAADKGQSFVSIVDVENRNVIRRIAVRGLTHHTAISPDGKTAIAVHSGVGSISVIDLDKMAVVKTLDTGPQPNYAVFNRNGKRLYVSNAGSDNISVIDTTAWVVTNEIKVGKEPEHIVRGRRVNRLYVANAGDGTVAAVDISNNNVINSFQIGPEPHGVDISGDGRWLFAASKAGNSLKRIEVTSGKSKSIELGPAPYHVKFIRGMNKLYVSSHKLSKIWVINPATLKITGEIDLGAGIAHQMVIRED